MKIIIYTLYVTFLISTSLFAKTIDTDYVAITTGIGGTTAVGGGAPLYTTPNMWLNLEFKIPVIHDKIYLYSQLRTSFFIGQSSFPYSYLLPIINMESLRIGGLLGLGAIVKDTRNENATGWYLTLNFGILFEGSIHNFNPDIDFDLSKINSIYDQFLNLGFELNTRFIYQVKPYLKFSIGAQIGYLYNFYSGDPFYVGLNKQLVGFHMLTYGITFGVHF